MGNFVGKHEWETMWETIIEKRKGTVTETG